MKKTIIALAVLGVFSLTGTLSAQADKANKGATPSKKEQTTKGGDCCKSKDKNAETGKPADPSKAKKECTKEQGKTKGKGECSKQESKKTKKACH